MTTPDRVTMRAGEGSVVDVTANDSDPDGDQLEVCRVGPFPRAVGALVQDGDLVVLPSRRAHGTYTLTYYVCDQSYLTAGHLTSVGRPPDARHHHGAMRSGGSGRNTYKHQTFPASGRHSTVTRSRARRS